MYVPDVWHDQTLPNGYAVSYVEGENNRFIRKETVVSLLRHGWLSRSWWVSGQKSQLMYFKATAATNPVLANNNGTFKGKKDSSMVGVQNVVTTSILRRCFLPLWSFLNLPFSFASWSLFHFFVLLTLYFTMTQHQRSFAHNSQGKWQAGTALIQSFSLFPFFFALLRHDAGTVWRDQWVPWG